MTFRFPKKLPQEWIKQLENLSVNTRFKNLRVASRDRRGTIVHLGGDAYKILHNGKNQNVFGNPLVGRGLDPTFGYETIGAALYAAAPYIQGSWFTCPEAGTADSINMYGGTPYDTSLAKCAIYKKSDNSLVGGTEEITVSDVEQWWTLNFPSPKPSLENVDYYLVMWSNFIVKFFYDTETNKGSIQSIVYGTWPDPWRPTLLDRRYSIYCTYTVAMPRLTIESTPIIGVPVIVDGETVGSTPVSTGISTGDHSVTIPSEQERSRR